jgi:hypothetical protein
MNKYNKFYAPEYQIKVQQMFELDCQPVFVVIIQSEKEDVEKLVKMFQAAKEDNKLAF